MLDPVPVPTYAGPTPAQVTVAVARARAVIGRQRRPDGSWLSLCDLGPAATAQVLVGLRFIDRLDEGDAREARRWLIARQRSDGGFVAHPFAAQADLGATACAWAAFAATGLGPDDEPFRKARDFVDRAGGLPALADRLAHGDPSALFVAMMGLVSPDELPEPDLLFAVVPPLEKLIERRFNILVPITLLQTGLLLRFLRGEAIGGLTPAGLLAHAEARRCLELLDTFQNPDGSWLYGDTMHAALCLATFRATGLPADDPRFGRGLDFLRAQAVRDRDGLWFSIFGTDIWPTAFALRALLASDAPRDGVEVVEAVRWLVAHQRRVDANNSGTWSFQSGNQTMPDSDDVGVVLGPLAMALDASGAHDLPAEVAGLVRPCIERGLSWLLPMQNPDGGWPAFQHGLPSKRPGAMMTGEAAIPRGGLIDKLRFLLNPPAELGDPSTEDVTGRVLHGLGQVGYTAQAPEVQRALAFLRSQQVGDGSFWGRWVVNYLAGTAWVLRGLAAVEAPLEEEWVGRAIGFLLAHQNPDGGWGEDVASYRDPALAGRGPSNAGLTGLVISALIEVGEGQAAVAAGVRYLLREQRPDGTWPNGTLLSTLVPPSLFYTLPGTELQLPLEALGLFCAAIGGRIDPALPASENDATRARAFSFEGAAGPAAPRDARGAWSPRGLAPLVAAGDPLADAVIDELFAAGEIAAVNDLLVTLARMVDPVPAALPPLTHAFFERAGALPPWADRALMRKAEVLFTRCGWAVGAVLFCSSLPQCYAFPEGARVLLYTHGTSRHARRRIVETAQLVFDVAAEGGMEPQGAGRRSAQKVRLMHAAIRHLIEAQTSWNPAWGVPINQVELAGTLLSFSCLVVDGVRRLGVEVTDEEADAWIHLWNVVGALLGLRDDILPRGMADGEALFDVLRTHWRVSPEGQELTRATLDLMRELLPGQTLDGLPAALVRHLAGDHCADLLAVPPADWTALLVDAAARLGRIVDLADRSVHIGGLARRASFDVMKALHGWSREGKPVQFRIPEALLRRWDDGAG